MVSAKHQDAVTFGPGTGRIEQTAAPMASPLDSSEMRQACDLILSATVSLDIDRVTLAQTGCLRIRPFACLLPR